MSLSVDGPFSADYGGGKICVVDGYVYRVPERSRVVVNATGVSANGVALPKSTEKKTPDVKVDRENGCASMTATNGGSAGRGNVNITGPITADLISKIMAMVGGDSDEE